MNANYLNVIVHFINVESAPIAALIALPYLARESRAKVTYSNLVIFIPVSFCMVIHVCLN